MKTGVLKIQYLSVKQKNFNPIMGICSLKQPPNIDSRIKNISLNNCSNCNTLHMQPWYKISTI
jgi:hypothetical protein